MCLWHDLRHTWASWYVQAVQAGSPLRVLQELGGWESVEMVRRYAHLSSEYLAEYVDRLSALRTIDDPIGYDLVTVKKRPVTMNATGLLEYGAGDGTRTRDRLITNQLLYQLSYTSAVEPTIIQIIFIMSTVYVDFF